MSSSYGHHAAGGPSPGAHASFHPGTYSNISPLYPLRKSTQDPSQLMGSSHSKNTPPSSSFKAVVSGSIGFNRVFASKRKKSLDLSARSAEHDLPRPLSSVDTIPEVSYHLLYLYIITTLIFFQTLDINVRRSVVRHSEPPPLPPKHHDSTSPSPMVAEYLWTWVWQSIPTLPLHLYKPVHLRWNLSILLFRYFLASYLL